MLRGVLFYVYPSVCVLVCLFVCVSANLHVPFDLCKCLWVVKVGIIKCVYIQMYMYRGLKICE